MMQGIKGEQGTHGCNKVSRELQTVQDLSQWAQEGRAHKRCKRVQEGYKRRSAGKQEVGERWHRGCKRRVKRA